MRPSILLAAVAVFFAIPATRTQASDGARIRVRAHTANDPNEDSSFAWSDTPKVVSNSPYFRCEVTGSPDAGRMVTLDCYGPDSYRAQTSADCSINKTQASAASLFVAQVGVSRANRNFLLWCAP